ILEKGYNIDYTEESLVNINIHNQSRISSSTYKVSSMNTEIINIKKRYMDDLNHKYYKLVWYEHYMQLANHTKEENKYNSLNYFLNALKYKKWGKRNLYYIFSLFLPRKLIMKIKKVIAK